MRITRFPKMFALGKSYVRDIFDGPVEITEKVDGSQFVFGWDHDGTLQVRSKGKEMAVDAPEKMFSLAVDYVANLPLSYTGVTCYCEYLRKPKHNTLEYDRVPKNNLALFGVSIHNSVCDETIFVSDHEGLSGWADDLGIDVVPLLGIGEFTPETAIALLDNEKSGFGDMPPEGIVVKNYRKHLIIGEADRVYPIMAAKYVTEKFKEQHTKGWGENGTPRNRYDMYVESFRTEARWQKAVQHLQETGEFEADPKVIGRLVKRVQEDIREEEQEAIRAFLYQEFSPAIYRKSTAGLPEWFKKNLALGAYESEAAA